MFTPMDVFYTKSHICTHELPPCLGDQQSTKQRQPQPLQPPALPHTKGAFCHHSGYKPIKHQGLGECPKKSLPGEIRALNHFDVCTSAPVTVPTPPVHSRLRFSLEIKITLVRRCCGFFPRLNAETADECRLSRGPLARLEAGEFLWSFSRFSQAENRQGEHKSKGRHSG